MYNLFSSHMLVPIGHVTDRTTSLLKYRTDRTTSLLKINTYKIIVIIIIITIMYNLYFLHTSQLVPIGHVTARSSASPSGGRVLQNMSDSTLGDESLV